MDADITTQKEPANREVDSTILSARALYQHDPLLGLLKDRLHLSTLWIVVGGFVYGGLLCFVFIPIINSYFPIFNNFHPFGSLGDTLDLLLLTLAFTLSMLIYLLLPASMAWVFNTLRGNGVIGPSRQERLSALSYARFLEHMVAWVHSRWWSIGIVLFAIVYFLYNVFITNPQLLALPTLWLLVIFVIAFLPFQYLLFLGFLRVMLLLIFINRLFLLFNIRVKSLHPDGAGGLAALSQMWWLSTAIIFVIALDLFAIYGHPVVSISPFDIITVTIIYLTLIVALAIGWLALPHHVMVQARNEHLQPLTEEYGRVLMETRPAADEEAAQIVTGTERLSALKQRYELVRDTFPTWPIQIVELSRLAGALLLPALITLLPALLSAFTKK